MNWKRSPEFQMPVGSMEMCMVAQGKTYGVYPQDVMDDFRAQEGERIKSENPEFNEEQVNNAVDEILESLGIGTSAWIYAKMTPKEQKDYAARYRFGGIVRVWK